MYVGVKNGGYLLKVPFGFCRQHGVQKSRGFPPSLIDLLIECIFGEGTSFTDMKDSSLLMESKFVLKISYHGQVG